MSQLGDTSQRWCFGGARSVSLELNYGTLEEAVPHDKGILEMRVCFDPLCNDFRRVEVRWCPPDPIGGVQYKTGKPFHVYKLKPSPNPLAETGAGFGYCAERLHAEWQEWGEWSLCSKTCQETNGQAGTQTRRAGCTEGLTGGRTCDELIRIQHWNERETRTCNEVCCPRNGEFRAWSSWGACSKSCSSKGGSAGEQRRTRTCTPASCGGQPCAAADLLQRRVCNGFDTAPCPINGLWGAWGQWSACILPVGKCFGTKKRERKCDNPKPEHGGRNCQGGGGGVQIDGCTVQEKCPVDCQCTEWGKWESCSITCKNCGAEMCINVGNQRRTRWCSVEKNGGITCRAKYGNFQPQTRPCPEVPACPIDCTLTGWSDWAECDPSKGTRTKTRTVLQEARYGGEQCNGDKSRDEICAVNCQCDSSTWGEWSPCTSRMTSTKERVRICLAAKNGGIPCHSNPLRQDPYAERQHAPCPVDCICNEFSKVWTPCSQSCTPAGGSHGKQTIKRICVEGVHGGKTCKQKYEIELGQPLTRTRECNTEACPVDCICQEFNDTWSSCSKSCTPEGGISGVQTSERVCIEGSNGGKTCKQKYEIDLKQPLTRTRECNTLCCPIDGNFVF